MAEVNVISYGYSERISDPVCLDSPFFKSSREALPGSKLMKANCTCSLVTTPKNVIIVDTMTCWDRSFIQEALMNHGVDRVDYVISTHGHSDHIGNNNLFLDAVHIVGYSINHKNLYLDHNFMEGEEFVIDDLTTVVPTPGHTSEDVSLVIDTKSPKGVISIVGDLFERVEDLSDITLWKPISNNPKMQAENRLKMLYLSTTIVPGHGPPFQVLAEHIKSAENQLNSIERACTK